MPFLRVIWVWLAVVLSALSVQAQVASITSITTFLQAGASFTSYDNLNGRLADQGISTEIRTPTYEGGFGTYLVFEDAWQLGFEASGYFGQKTGLDPELQNRVIQVAVYNGYRFEAARNIDIIPALGLGYAWTDLRLIYTDDTLPSNFNAFLGPNSGSQQQYIKNRNLFLDVQVQGELRPVPRDGFTVGLRLGYRLGLGGEWQIDNVEGAQAPNDPFSGFHADLRIGWTFRQR